MKLSDFITAELMRVRAFERYHLHKRGEMLAGGATEEEANEVRPLELPEEEWVKLLSDFYE